MLCPLSLGDDNWRSMFHTWWIHHHALTLVMRRWRQTEHDSKPWVWIAMLRPLLLDHDNWGSCFIHEGYITMLWPLSWDDDNWQSMLHILGVNNHALSVVMRRWKLTEHVSYLWNTLLCFDRCHETMVTDRAWFIPQGWITMLWLLSLDDDN